jgi:hypothetical protein
VRRGFRAIWLAPLLALVALGGWVFASPAGSSPDDDYHLVSIWCSAGDRTSLCEESGDPSTRMVSRQLLDINCFARDSTESAACQTDVLDRHELVEADRGNFVGAYPPLFYGVMSLFAGDDVLTSILVMRFVNVLLLIGFASALYLLLPRRRVPTLLWGWLVTVVPLGLFLIASNNPSAWAIIGVGTLPLALLGYFETEGRRRIMLAAVAVLATLVAAGSRADSAVYAILVVGAIIVLTAVRGRAYLLRAVLPLVLVILAAVFIFFSAQLGAGIDGFTPSAVAPTGGHGFSASDGGSDDVLGLLFSNILNAPSLWAGVFGYWSLGWFDTPLPAVVAFGGVGVFAAAGFTGLRDLNGRKLIVAAATAVGIWVIPVYTLTRGGQPVGVEVQPRYLLPLIVVLGMFLLLTTAQRVRWFTRVQTILLGVTLTGAAVIALYFNIRRYVTGDDVQGMDLGSGLEWWWTGLPGPMAVFAIASLAWAGLIIVLLRELHRGLPGLTVVDEPAPVPSAR